MKKASLIGAAAALTLSGLMAVTSTPALADSANAAVVINDDGCSPFVPGTPGSFFFDPDGNRHITRNSAGTFIFTCTGALPDALVPPELRILSGFPCGNPVVGITTDTVMRATPGGQYMLTCRLTSASAPAP